MKHAQCVRLGAWFLIAANLLMALGSIWIFVRMAPAIKVIIEQNERSLHACQEMLSCLALAQQTETEKGTLINVFKESLSRAQSNITERDEPLALDRINAHYSQAFAGQPEALDQTVSAITHLSEINREAMVQAEQKARQFGNAGAWGIAFMATGIFTVGMLFIRSLKTNLLIPLEELHSVVTAYRSGETMRRCTGPDMPKDIRVMFNDVNELLDRIQSDSLSASKPGEQ